MISDPHALKGATSCKGLWVQMSAGPFGLIFQAWGHVSEDIWPNLCIVEQATIEKISWSTVALLVVLQDLTIVGRCARPEWH